MSLRIGTPNLQLFISRSLKTAGGQKHDFPRDIIQPSCGDQALIAGQNEIAHKASAVYGTVGFLHGVGKPMGEIYGRLPLSERVQNLTPQSS